MSHSPFSPSHPHPRSPGSCGQGKDTLPPQLLNQGHRLLGEQVPSGSRAPTPVEGAEFPASSVKRGELLSSATSLTQEDTLSQAHRAKNKHPSTPAPAHSKGRKATQERQAEKTRGHSPPSLEECLRDVAQRGEGVPENDFI